MNKKRKYVPKISFKPLAANPTLQAMKVDLSDEGLRAKQAAKAKELKEKLSAPTLDLTSKYSRRVLGKLDPSDDGTTH